MFKKTKETSSRPDSAAVREWAFTVLGFIRPFCTEQKSDFGEVNIMWSMFGNRVHVTYKGVEVYRSTSFAEDISTYRYNYGSWVELLRQKAQEVAQKQKEEYQARFADLEEN